MRVWKDLDTQYIYILLTQKDLESSVQLVHLTGGDVRIRFDLNAVLESTEVKA